MEKIGSAVVHIIVFALIVLYSSFSYAFVLDYFWDWFILPIFKTLPNVSFYEAMGIAMFITLLKTKRGLEVIKDEYIDKKKSVKDLVLQISSPWISFAIGYIIYLIIK